MGSRLLRWKLMRLFDDLGDNPSHSWRDSTLRFFKRLIDEGYPFIAVPLTFSSSKLSRFPQFFGNSLIFEHPDKVRIFRDIKLILLGRLLRHLQPLRSSWISRLRFPRDAWILDSLVQPQRINFFKFGDLLKFGVSIKFWE